MNIFYIFLNFKNRGSFVYILYSILPLCIYRDLFSNCWGWELYNFETMLPYDKLKNMDSTFPFTFFFVILTFVFFLCFVTVPYDQWHILTLFCLLGEILCWFEYCNNLSAHQMVSRILFSRILNFFHQTVLISSKELLIKNQ